MGNNMELLANGIKLLVCGMGVVYVFLVVMIFAINVMGIVLRPWIDKFEPKPAAAKPAAAPAAGEADIVAAAVAAVALRRIR